MRRRNGNGQPAATTLTLADCLPEIRAAARKVRKPGQLFVVVSESEVWVVNR